MTASELQSNLIIRSYRVLGQEQHGEITIQESRQIDDSVLWAVRRGGCVLDKKGRWEIEPMPSSRTDAFLKRCRFDSVAKACEVLAKVL